MPARSLSLPDRTKTKWSVRDTPTIKKIIFESFGPLDEVEEEVIVEDVVEEIEEIEEIVPTFSEEQVIAAREEGIAIGREQERTEILGAIEQQTMKTMASVEKHLGELFNAQENANEAMLRDGLVVATAVVRRLFPGLSQEHAQKEVEDVITSVMEMVIDEPRVAVTVNEKLHPHMEKIITEMAAKKGFAGKLTLLSDENIQIGDCKVVWGKGSAVRDTEAMWREIDAIIERKVTVYDKTSQGPENTAQEDTELEVPDDEMPNVDNTDIDSANQPTAENNATDGAGTDDTNSELVS